MASMRKVSFFAAITVAAALIFAPGVGRAADPPTTPPFTECPPVGASHGCAVLIVFNSDGSTTILSDPNSGNPFELSDDATIGIYNKSGFTIPSVRLTSAKKIFGFDGDGMCSRKAERNGGMAPGCPYDTDTSHPGYIYAGPGITYSDIATDFRSGRVNFASSCTGSTECASTPGGITDGSTVFFSLENVLNGADIMIPTEDHITSVKTASKDTAAVGDTVTYTITLSNSGNAAGTTDVVDDYDEAHLTNITGITGGGVNDSPSAGKIKWTAVSVPPGTDTVTLSYTGTISGSFSGSNGDCGTDKFPLTNNVTLTNGGGTSKTICVSNPPPAPHITSTKSVSPNPASVGDTVTYTIKLSNDGGVAGTSDVVDDYDEAHIKSISDITGGGVNDSPSAGMIKWTAVNVPVGTDTVTLSYTGVVTGPFSGPNGDCEPGQFPVNNSVTLTVTTGTGAGTDNLLCVTQPTLMTGRAFGGSLSLLDSPLIDPTADTGPIETADDSFTDECALALPIPSDPGFILNIRVLCGTVQTDKATKTSTASASVAHVTVALPGAPVIDIGAIESSSTTDCTGSVGHTNILSLKVDGEEMLPFEDAIPEGTVIPLGIGELRINEQIPITGAESGLTVNAVHLVIPGVIDLVLASAESDISGCP